MRGSWKASLDPQTSVPSLTPLDAPRTSGFSRRPRWLSSFTTSVAAANVWRILQARDDGRRQQQHTRTFARGHTVNRSGVKQHVLWRTRVEKELKLQHDAEMKAYYSALDRWQTKPVGPMPRRPSAPSADLAARLGHSSFTSTAGSSTATGASTSTSCMSSSSPRPTSTSTTSASSSITSSVARRPAPHAGGVRCKASVVGGPEPLGEAMLATNSAGKERCLPKPIPRQGAHSSTTSSSSSGSSAIPYVATTLKELREDRVAVSNRTKLTSFNSGVKMHSNELPAS